MSRRIPTLTLAAALAATLAAAPGLDAQEAPRYAGPTATGFLLPNGWTISPAGDQVPLSDLPLNILPLADGRHALVATAGYNAHQLSLVDLEAKAVVDAEAVRQGWFGLAKEPDGDRVWWSGGGGDRLHAFRLAGRAVERISPP